MSNTVSPTPKNFSATERRVGSGIADVSGLEGMRILGIRHHRKSCLNTDENPLDLRTPATTVDNNTASTV
jgi:hypothetical protein